MATTTTIAHPQPAYRTSIGRKMLVAGSGIIGLLYVFAHMVGNLHVFQGPKQLDSYSDYLRRMGEPIFPRSFILWCIRIVVLLALIVHVYFTVQLARRSRASRRNRYGHPSTVQASYASRTMRWGGAFLFLFIVFHLMDLSWGTAQTAFVRGAVYHNVVTGFRHWVVSLVYLAAMVALALHIYHGTWSVSQTLGIDQARWRRPVRRLAVGAAVVIPGGFAVVPLAVLVRIVH